MPLSRYNTLRLNRPLSEIHQNYLDAFSKTIRRIRRLPENTPDPLRVAVGLPLGSQGEFYVGLISSSNGTSPGDESTTDEEEITGDVEDEAQKEIERHALMVGDEQLFTRHIPLWDEKTVVMDLPAGQPSSICCWTPTHDGHSITLQEGIWLSWQAWLTYLIDHFFKPWGYLLTGTVQVYRDRHTVTDLIVKDNIVKTTRYYRRRPHSVMWWDTGDTTPLPECQLMHGSIALASLPIF